MKKVGLRELKNHLSKYVRQVRGGQSLLVTDRGQVVAELVPPGSAATSGERYVGLTALAQRGEVTLGSPNNPSLYPAMPAVVPPGTAERLLHEERGEG